MTVKFVYKTLGGHTHIAVFAGTNSFEKCGDLVFRNEEWRWLKSKLSAMPAFLFEEHTS